MKFFSLKKESRTFMPEILFPGTGLSPITDKSVVPTNNIHTIQDVLNGKKYRLPNAGGNWGQGEDYNHHYKEEGDLYKRKERDAEILFKNLNKQPIKSEKWQIKMPGGSRIFDSFYSAQNYIHKMKDKGINVQWVSKIANQNRNFIIYSSLEKTFKIESFNTISGIKKTGSSFCISKNYFVTCAHVVCNNLNGNDSINIQSLNRQCQVLIMSGSNKFSCKIIAVDAAKDIALLMCDIKVDPLILDINVPKVGTEIFTIGSPYGVENNASFGNISSVNKQIFSHKGAPKSLFVDAPVFSGNSGGPIVDIETGFVIGMLTSVFSKKDEYGLNLGLPSFYLNNFLLTNKIF